MIISFSDDIFEINDPKLQEDLADIFSCIIEDKCLVDVSNLIDIFYDENGVYIFNDIEFAEKFLSTSKKLRLEDYINALIDKTAYLTDQHTKYLSSYKIGSKEEFISISEGLRLLRNPSKIILENAVNDWKFIQGIVDKYRNQKQRKSIYKLIERCITEGFLEAEQAGGKGQIRARIDDLFNNRYKNIGSKKIMALFDSDR
ncbi:MAG: hypothetical protein GXC73_13585, partial [Chitinophagaceae bacterium]|nr:hypothetical protein [Chitinophagaceae bacterium]